jgi:hypothetical protein
LRLQRGLRSPPNSVRILADTNIVAQAVRSLRDGGHDVVYAAERTMDPGDEALLAEAVRENRVFLTKDHDVGTLVYRDLCPRRGVLLVDDLYQQRAFLAWRRGARGYPARQPWLGPRW